MNARLAWCLVPLLGLLELGFALLFSARAPDAADWHALGASVDRVRHPGDLVVVTPEWAEPLARHALGARRMPLADLARPDQAGYLNAVEVSVLGARSEEFSGWRELARQESDGFVLRRLANPHPERALYHFVERVRPETLSVALGVSGRESACGYTSEARTTSGGLGGHPTYPRERFECAGADPALVAVSVIDDERYRPRRCILARLPEAARLRLDFHDVPLGASLHGYVGMPYLIARDGEFPPVELVVFIDDRRVGARVARGEDGWRAFELATPGAAGRRGRVRFELQSRGASELCFQAETR